MSEKNAYGSLFTKVVDLKWIINWKTDLVVNWLLQYRVWLMIFPFFPSFTWSEGIGEATFVVAETVKSGVAF